MVVIRPLAWQLTDTFAEAIICVALAGSLARQMSAVNEGVSKIGDSRHLQFYTPRKFIAQSTRLPRPGIQSMNRTLIAATAELTGVSSRRCQRSRRWRPAPMSDFAVGLGLRVLSM